MPLREILQNKSTNSIDVAKNIVKKHEPYLANVSIDQIQRMVEMVIKEQQNEIPATILKSDSSTEKQENITKTITATALEKLTLPDSINTQKPKTIKPPEGTSTPIPKIILADHSNPEQIIPKQISLSALSIPSALTSTSELAVEIEEDFDFESDKESEKSEKDDIPLKKPFNALRSAHSQSGPSLPSINLKNLKEIEPEKVTVTIATATVTANKSDSFLNLSEPELMLSSSKDLGSPPIIDSQADMKSLSFSEKDLKKVSESLFDYTKMDLNKLNDEELKNVKDKMEVGFEINRIKPGDEKFVYDVQKSFEPAVEKNEWDSSSESSSKSLKSQKIEPHVAKETNIISLSTKTTITVLEKVTLLEDTSSRPSPLSNSNQIAIENISSIAVQSEPNTNVIPEKSPLSSPQIHSKSIISSDKQTESIGIEEEIKEYDDEFEDDEEFEIESITKSPVFGLPTESKPFEDEDSIKSDKSLLLKNSDIPKTEGSRLGALPSLKLGKLPSLTSKLPPVTTSTTILTYPTSDVTEPKAVDKTSVDESSFVSNHSVVLKKETDYAEKSHVTALKETDEVDFFESVVIPKQITEQPVSSNDNSKSVNNDINQIVNEKQNNTKSISFEIPKISSDDEDDNDIISETPPSIPAKGMEWLIEKPVVQNSYIKKIPNELPNPLKVETPPKQETLVEKTVTSNDSNLLKSLVKSPVFDKRSIDETTESDFGIGNTDDSISIKSKHEITPANTGQLFALTEELSKTSNVSKARVEDDIESEILEDIVFSDDGELSGLDIDEDDAF